MWASTLFLYEKNKTKQTKKHKKLDKTKQKNQERYVIFRWFVTLFKVMDKILRIIKYFNRGKVKGRKKSMIGNALMI